MCFYMFFLFVCFLFVCLFVCMFFCLLLVFVRVFTCIWLELPIGVYVWALSVVTLPITSSPRQVVVARDGDRVSSLPVSYEPQATSAHPTHPEVAIGGKVGAHFCQDLCIVMLLIINTRLAFSEVHPDRACTACTLCKETSLQYTHPLIRWNSELVSFVRQAFRRNCSSQLHMYMGIVAITSVMA